ncbi:M17 family metallopeptidase [Paenibacillus taiwanensis]|uniref:M17 family metallopeptidase n=1 Tax=Paenibacillus taiwanensis TaxID=401638 RepID=UPI0004281A4F|nr:leucyl aminopeptidase family protein [Paenibacillus taiwanensis]
MIVIAEGCCDAAVVQLHIQDDSEDFHWPLPAGKWRVGEHLLFYSRSAEEPTLMVIHMGNRRGCTREIVKRAASSAARKLRMDGFESARLMPVSARARTLFGISSEEWLTAWAEGWLLGNYQFQQYKTALAESQPVYLQVDRELFSTMSVSMLEHAVHTAKIRAQGNILARDLVNEPANTLFPGEFVERIVSHFKAAEGVQTYVYQGEELVQQQMNGLIAVGAGSKHPPAMVQMRYTTDPELPLLALIGKGITFDMGGMNIKHGNDISDARMDMGGAAAVIGALDIVVSNKLNVNIVALIPIAENIPDAKALLPSSIIHYPNNMTVQVGNTDGEGRLILADALLHAERLGAKQVIDIATLTGNVGAALGLGIAGIWGDEQMSAHLVEAGEKCGERLWPMPLMDEYECYLHSDYADINNTSSSPLAGAITAALFLRRFVATGMTWTHIDMAGTSQYKAETAYAAAGASGYGACLLADYVAARASCREK